MPSHGAGRQISVQPLERPAKTEHERDGKREEQQLPEAGSSTPSMPPDQIDVLDDTGGPPSTRRRSPGDIDEKNSNALLDTCKKRPSKARLNKTVEWSRRHLRFIGPGLSEL